MHSQL
jgi:hypothetical protein